MRYILLIWIFIVGDLNAQDSSVRSSSIPKFSVRGVFIPYVSTIVMLEKSINNQTSLAVGFKQNNIFIGSSQGKNNVLILEYRYYFSDSKKETYYLSPYLKLRELNLHQYFGYGSGLAYYEKSLGIGCCIGERYYLNKKRTLDINIFAGCGYFFNLGSNSNYKPDYYSPSMINEVNPDIIFTRLDMRIGALFGINFL